MYVSRSETDTSPQADTRVDILCLTDYLSGSRQFDLDVTSGQDGYWLRSLGFSWLYRWLCGGQTKLTLEPCEEAAHSFHNSKTVGIHMQPPQTEPTVSI